MRQRAHLTICGMFSAMLLGAAASAFGACSKPMTMIAEHFPPYLFEDPQKPGLDVKLAQAIFREAGCILLVAPEVPAMHRWELFEQGKFDLLTGATDLAERRSFAWVTLPYRDETVALFANAGDFDKLRDIDSFEKLEQRGVMLLSPRTGWYGKELEQHKGALKKAGLLSEFTSISQGIRRMQLGRAALIVSDTLAVRYESKIQGVKLRALPYEPHHAPIHIMLSKASTTDNDRRLLDEAIERLRARGALAAILATYPVD